MAATEDTPVTLPGARIVRAESPTLSGVPEEVEFENTGKIVSDLIASGASEDLMSAFVQKAAEAFAASSGGGGDDDSNPEKTLREIKKHKWLAALMALLFGSGGMVGSYYALKAQAASNTEKVEQVEAAAKATEPVIEKNTDDIRLIKVDVSNINKSVGEMKTQQTAIVNGINTLKKEAQTEKQTRLEEKVKALERENRRLERNR